MWMVLILVLALQVATQLLVMELAVRGKITIAKGFAAIITISVACLLLFLILLASSAP